MRHDPDAVQKMADAYTVAWCSHDPAQVASFYAPDGSIQINRGDVLKGTEAIETMAAAFFAQFPDLVVRCDGVRVAADHVAFLWTLEGSDANTQNHVKLPGWEEWTLTDDLKVQTSLGWFDKEDELRQIAGD